MTEADCGDNPVFPHGCFALGRSISILHRFSQRFVDAKLRDCNLNKAQMEVLIILIKSEKVLNQTELNRYFGYNKATITKLINSLEREGYVIRLQSESDKRERVIELTARGRNVNKRIVEVLVEEEKIFGEILGADDGDSVREQLYKLAEALNDYDPVKRASGRW